MTRTEPVALGALVQLVLNAVLVILTAFNVTDLNAEQTAALFGGANALVAVIVALKTRSVVFSTATVENAERESALDPH